MSKPNDAPRPLPRSASAPKFEWQVALGPWRWLILGTLGVAPSACGGRTGGSEADQDVANLQEPPEPIPLPQRGPASSPGPVSGAGSANAGGSAGFGTAGAGGTASSGSAGAVDVSTACVLESTLEGGWERCTNGMVHRRELGSCSSRLPRPDQSLEAALGYPVGVDAGVAFACLRDSDCTEADHGHCELGQGGPYCEYGCLVDADCGASQVCLCGPDIGQCVLAQCSTDADCGASSLCGSYEYNPHCGGTRFACQVPEDRCAGDRDCGEFGICSRELDYSSNGEPMEAKFRSCTFGGCIVGRPFSIDGAERLAPSVVRSDWYSSNADFDRTAAERASSSAAIAQGWREQALMEHASVAAFARFSLQLLQLGAPADLVAAAAAAMQDEIRHARACFDLARRHSSEDVGPGPLAMDGALDSMDPTAIVLDALREGCICETVAAIEASEALQHCEDPAARAVLERIAVEEGQHAELAWRFVAWALETRPALAQQVREAFEQELAGARPGQERAPRDVAASDRELARHGLLSPALRAALRDRVLAGVVAPCAKALLAGAGWERPDASRTARADRVV
jgi:hypothetical protein